MCTYFKQAMGITLHQYILQRRLKRAKRLISSSQLPLAEITLSCGFSSYSHMSQQMRKALGITPRQIRLADAKTNLIVDYPLCHYQNS